MKDWDDEICRALAHLIRRRIIENLQERNDLSFRELLKCVAISNHGKLGFHIRALRARGLVEREPSTKKYRLTDRGQLAGELIWDIRFAIDRGGRDLAHEPTRYARRLRFGDHAVLFYDTEDDKREISFPFLEAGLPKGEAVVYLVSEHKLDSESRIIQRYGISADYFRKEAFTIMSADEWYLEKGKAQAKTIIANTLTLLKEKQKAGFTGLRRATEMEVFFNYAKIKELLRYEAALGRQLPPNLCELCLYDTHRLDENQFVQLKKKPRSRNLQRRSFDKSIHCDSEANPQEIGKIKRIFFILLSFVPSAFSLRLAGNIKSSILPQKEALIEPE